MKRPRELAREEAAMGTLVKLTSSFEGIASMRIAQIKDQVIQSTRFFNELWEIYSQINVDSRFQFGREKKSAAIDKELYVVITAEGGFSGDIDQKLLRLMISEYDQSKQDIIVIGSHGAAQLAQKGIQFKKYFKMPTKDKDINVAPIIREVQHYRSTKLYYQEYLSLMRQDVKSMMLSTAVQERGNASQQAADDTINERTYIFEPSTYAVVAHLERSMMQIAISQLLLESKLAQYAARFRAMSMSHQRASDAKDELHLDYNRARRSVKDERLKEIINGLKKVRAGARA